MSYDRRGKPTRATIPFGPWRLVVDQFTQSTGETSQTYMRVRALFVRDAPFRLRVTRRNPFHRLAEWLGIRSVEIGYSRVDRTLFVRSDRADVARQMLRGTSLGQALLSDPKQTLKVQPPGRGIRRQTGDKTGEVQVIKSGKSKDLSVLRSMVQIAMWTLQEMVRGRVAREVPVENATI